MVYNAGIIVLVMSKILKISVGLGALIIITIGYWLISPLFLNRIVSEEIDDIKEPTGTIDNTYASMVIARGSFMNADSFHKVQGTAKLLEIDHRYFVRFEEDFQATNGPDLFVYFGKNGTYIKEAKIAALKGNIGSQNYEVPSDVDPLDYTEIWIWCRAFSVPFGHAVLQAS